MEAKEIKALWRTLPLAKDNNLQQLDSQIECSPKVWLLPNG